VKDLLRAPTHPTYPQSGQPGFAWTVPPLEGLAYTTPHSRHRTLSRTVNLGASPESDFTCKKTPLFAETCVALVAKEDYWALRFQQISLPSKECQ
jgi:hypothetical protein